MDLLKVQLEFQIRGTYWYASELDKELREGFPNFGSFCSGFGWRLRHYFEGLPGRDQLILASALSKRSPEYLRETGEAMSKEESVLLQSFDRLHVQPTKREDEIERAKANGEIVPLASKAKLRKVAVEKFISAYGRECTDMKTSKEWDPLFSMRRCGWLARTQLIFGRSRGLMSYRIIIESENRITHPENDQISGAETTLTPGFGWIVNRWDDVFDEEVNRACDALIRQIGFCFDALPTLLKGLEYEKISGTNLSVARSTPQFRPR